MPRRPWGWKMVPMNPINANLARKGPAAVLVLACLVGIVVLASCGGEQSTTPTATFAPSSLEVSTSPPPTPEPTASSTPSPVKPDAREPEPTPSLEPEPTLDPTPAVMQEPAATPTTVPTPAPSPTPTSVPTPTPIPTAIPVPTPVPAPPIGVVDETVTRRDGEYHYAIELSDNWQQEWPGRYGSESPWGRLEISSQHLPSGYSLEPILITQRL